MAFFSTPAGYKPADSMTIALATAGGVIVLYGSKVGPIADVHATASGDPNVNASIRKAGWESIVLVAAMTLLSRDLNVAILGFELISDDHLSGAGQPRRRARSNVRFPRLRLDRCRGMPQRRQLRRTSWRLTGQYRYRPR